MLVTVILVMVMKHEEACLMSVPDHDLEDGKYPLYVASRYIDRRLDC